MEQDLIQKAKAHAAQVFDTLASKIKGRYLCIVDIRKELEDTYLAGAKEALASQWISIDDAYPEDEEYVLIDSPSGIQPAVWNGHYECWDDAEGDDIMYNKGAVQMWMRIPEPPNPSDK